jgi:tetratricopeptide (TPR) repeat protein
VAFSPDGRLALTGSEDDTARLWEVATGKPVGPPFQHRARVRVAAFRPDGRHVLTCGDDNRMRLWDMPHAAAGDPEQVKFWVNALTGLELDEAGGVRVLDAAIWKERRQRLGPDESGHPIKDDVSWHLWQARESEDSVQWFGARWHLDRLVAAVPADRDYRRRRALAAAHLGDWAAASRDFGGAVPPGNEDVQTKSWHALTLAAAGDWRKSRQACASLLGATRATANPATANDVAWCCSRFADSGTDPEEALKLAEKAVANDPKDANRLNTLGAALYRARRFREAVDALEKGMKLQGQGGTAWDWLFLAMAHQRLGHADEARNWLRKAGDWIDKAVKDDVKEAAPGIGIDWDNRLELQLIREAAEELIRPGRRAVPRPPEHQP